MISEYQFVCVCPASGSGDVNTSLTTATLSWLTYLGSNRTGHTHTYMYTNIHKYSNIHSGQDASFLKHFFMQESLAWSSCQISAGGNKPMMTWVSQISGFHFCFMFTTNEKAEAVALTIFKFKKVTTLLKPQAATDARQRPAFGWVFTRSSSWRVDTHGSMQSVPHTCSQLAEQPAEDE